MSEKGTPEHPRFAEAVAFWWKLGWISFGGPAGQIALMHDYIVTRRKWISNSRFLHALNYCMLLPGPEAQQLATYTGWLLHGIRGGIAAGLLFILPSVMILLVLSLLYSLYGATPWIASIFLCMKPAVLAIVILAMIRLGRKTLKGMLPWLVASGSLAGSMIFEIPFPLMLPVVAVLGWLVPAELPAPESASDTEEQGYLIHRDHTVPRVQISPVRIGVTMAVVAMLWLAPLMVLHVFHPQPVFWETLALFFTQASLVTFGGAYAVLPFVAEAAVHRFGWMSAPEMADGMALGESTPGPLIIVLAFVGYMAGYRMGNHDPWVGTLALLMTVYFTFLPGFGFILAGAPIIERTRNQLRFMRLLRFIPAAVIGVMGQLVFMLGNSVLFPAFPPSIENYSAFSLIWALISITVLSRSKISVIRWMGISAATGVVYWLLTSYLSGT